jgi:ribosomal protein S18 acetylase RimI-like enzyme
MGVAAAEVAARFRRGCRAHIGWHEGELAAYGWISEGREHVGELARDLMLPERESYVWDCATLPRFRGVGLYGGLLRAVVDELAARGQRRCWIGASSTNVASNRAFTTTGFRPVAGVVCLRLGGSGLLLRVRFHPGAGEGQVAAARYVLTGH